MDVNHVANPAGGALRRSAPNREGRKGEGRSAHSHHDSSDQSSEVGPNGIVQKQQPKRKPRRSDNVFD